MCVREKLLYSRVAKGLIIICRLDTFLALKSFAPLEVVNILVLFLIC